ncbi:MAG TPA: winged helix-turn-helix domain-containing protein [Nonomuraea sp.]|nr:winged helix-turn-helix domain-containing protein [Nonomuraea sp.]
MSSGSDFPRAEETAGAKGPAGREPTWTFLTNHARVLVILAGNPRARIRDIAAAIGITERAAHGIINDLVQEGYVERVREGRRNRYEIVPGGRLRHPSQNTVPVQGLIDLFAGTVAGPDTAHHGAEADQASPDTSRRGRD